MPHENLMDAPNADEKLMAMIAALNEQIADAEPRDRRPMEKERCILQRLFVLDSGDRNGWDNRTAGAMLAYGLINRDEFRSCNPRRLERAAVKAMLDALLNGRPGDPAISALRKRLAAASK